MAKYTEHTIKAALGSDESKLYVTAPDDFATNKMALPAAGMSLEISRMTTGTSTAIQETQNTAVSETDADDTLLSVPVRTIAGQQDLSRQAIELNKDKVFTLEDMGNLWDFCTYNKGTFAEFIQSLRESTEIEVEIKMEPCFYDQSLGGFSTSYTEDKPKEQPKLDEDGCLILKKI